MVMHKKIIICLGLVMLFLSCKKGNKASEQGSEKLTEIEFKEKEFDFGTLKQGQKVTHYFEFTNVGENDLIITNAQGSCGCTVPQYPLDPVKPGASSKIKVTFDSSHKEGEQNKSVTLFTNTENEAEKIAIKAFVETPKN